MNEAQYINSYSCEERLYKVTDTEAFLEKQVLSMYIHGWHIKVRQLETLTNSHENLVDVHRSLRWRFHEKQAVVVCVWLRVLQIQDISH